MKHLEPDAEPKKPEQHITIKAARRMLGMIGHNYSDCDMEEIFHSLYGIAELGFDLYQEHSAECAQKRAE